MIELDLVQGSDEWLKERSEHLTASEAPMMMGASKHISRTKLLDSKKGWTTEVDVFLQKLFDAGHQSEEMARPIAEQLIGAELYPVVGVLEDTKFMASFDGLTMMEDIVFEHKIYNKILAENVLNSTIGPDYYWQLEQQLMVSGAEKALFVCSDGTEENFYSMWYVSIPDRREQLIAGWSQFAIDLETHQPQAKTEKVVAEVITDLPAIKYKMDGMALTSNLDVFKKAATELVAKSKVVIETDQDFADADAMVKVFKATETKIRSLIEQVVGEVQDIDAFTKDLKFIGEEIRQARLSTDKQVKARKEELREVIATNAYIEVSTHSEIFVKLGVSSPVSDISINNAMKGKKTIDSLQDAADTAVSKIKIEQDGWFHIVSENANFMQDYKEFKFLFSDWKDIAFKANDDFRSLVKIRIAEHKEAAQKREDAQREQIRIEEEAKATAKINAENAAKQAAEQAKLEAEAELAHQKDRKAEKIKSEKNYAEAQAYREAAKAEQAKVEAEAKAIKLQEAMRIAEGNYESKIGDEGLAHRTQSAQVTSIITEKRAATDVEVAYMVGFMAGYNQVESLINPKKTASLLANEYTAGAVA